MKPTETVQVRNLSAGAVCVAHVTLMGGTEGPVNAKRFEVWFEKGGKRLFDAGLLERVGAPPAAAPKAKQPEPEPEVEPVAEEAPAAPEPEPVVEEEPAAEEPAAEEADEEPKKRTTRRR